jgi:hypothetical protein
MQLLFVDGVGDKGSRAGAGHDVQSVDGGSGGPCGSLEMQGMAGGAASGEGRKAAWESDAAAGWDKRVISPKSPNGVRAAMPLSQCRLAARAS